MQAAARRPGPAARKAVRAGPARSPALSQRARVSRAASRLRPPGAPSLGLLAPPLVVEAAGQLWVGAERVDRQLGPLDCCECFPCTTAGSLPASLLGRPGSRATSAKPGHQAMRLLLYYIIWLNFRPHSARPPKARGPTWPFTEVCQPPRKRQPVSCIQPRTLEQSSSSQWASDVDPSIQHASIPVVITRVKPYAAIHN
jgi:hypothetical protein